MRCEPRWLARASVLILMLAALPLAAQQPWLPAPTQLALAGASPADSSQTPPADPSGRTSHPWLAWPTATGGWNGLRERLAAHGIALSGGLTQDLSSNFAGGVRRGSVTRGLLDLGLELDLDSIAGLRGGSAFAGFHAHHGGNGSDLTGDIQAFSNIDAPDFARMGEVWYQQRLGGDLVRIKVGGVDANSEFAVLDAAGGFLNASGGFSPTVLGMPTYPTAPLSANLFVTPVSWLTAGAGIYRGVFGDRPTSADQCRSPFLIGEVAAGWSLAGLGEGRVLFGGWRNSGYAPDLDGTWQARPAGWYGAIAQRVSGAADGETPAHGVTLFGKFGAGPDGRFDVRQHVMAGATVDAPLGRAAHATGIMLSSVRLAGTGRETAVEGFYQFPLTGFLVLRPDLQYVASPSGVGADALAGTLRVDMSF
ncbi:MAG: carbohydrate porin [Gemmatimonadales bacterium]